MVLGYIQWCFLPQWQNCSLISWFFAHGLGQDVVRRWWNRHVQLCGLCLVASRNSDNQPLTDQLVRSMLFADSMLHFTCIRNLQKTRPTQFQLTNLRVLQIRSTQRKQFWKHHGATCCGLKSSLLVVFEWCTCFLKIFRCSVRDFTPPSIAIVTGSRGQATQKDVFQSDESHSHPVRWKKTPAIRWSKLLRIIVRKSVLDLVGRSIGAEMTSWGTKIKSRCQLPFFLWFSKLM